MVVKFKRIEPINGSHIFSLKKIILLVLVTSAFVIFLNREKFPIYANKIECADETDNSTASLESKINKIIEEVAQTTSELEMLEKNLRAIRKENEDLMVTNQELKSRVAKNRDSIDLIKRGIFEPSLIYERHKRRVGANLMHLWDFVDHRMSAIIEECKNDTTLVDVRLTIHEMINSLLADHAEMSSHDGFKKWRKKTLMDLEELVQKRLIYLQNPENCDEVKKLYCEANLFDCGLGCQIHHVAECLGIAYGLQRTLIFDASAFPYEFDEIFKPLSVTCTNLKENENIVDYPGTVNDNVLKVQHTMELPHIGAKFLFPVIPADLAPLLEKLFMEPTAWWQGQMKKYFLKLIPQLDDLVMRNVRKLNIASPIAGIHVRRSDKILVEADKHNVENYMRHVEMYFDRLSLFQKVEKRRVFVASDDLHVIEEVKAKYPHYEVIANTEAAAEVQDKGNRFSFEAVIGTLTDMYVLSKCDYVVCTFSSNIGRHIYQMMSTFRPDSYHRVRSLDARFHNFWEKDHYFVAVMNHKATYQSEIDMTAGDQIIVNTLFNSYGLYFATNRRTNKTGYIPAFKVEDIVDAVDFPTYPNVQ